MSDAEAPTTTERPTEQSTETLDVPLAELRPALEAVLMVADQPLDHLTLASAVGYPAERGASRRLQALADGVRRAGPRLRPAQRRRRLALLHPRGVRRRSSSGSSLDGQQARLTQAALETLAVVAYKQPVSRARVSAIRGVNVDGVMRTLVTRGLVEEAGQDAETTATLYRTTQLLPGADRRHVARRPARAGAVPAGHGRPRRPRRAGLADVAEARSTTTVTCMSVRDRLTTTAWSGCRSCSPSRGWPAAASARS